MQIAVISDLHLGRKDKLDQFARNPGAESRLYHLLAYLERHVDTIVLLGDIFDVYRTKLFGEKAFHKELREILKCYPKFTEKILTDPKYVLVQGNHDFPTAKVLNALKFYHVKDGSEKLTFFHGHQLDPFVEDFWARNFERFGCWAGGWLERAGLDITAKRNLFSKLKALNNTWPVSKFEHMASALGQQFGADVTITGHSHHPMKFETDTGLFLNSGARVCGRQDLLILDTRMHQYEVHKQFDVSSQGQTHELGECNSDDTMV